jgi:hypothetical protein
MSMNVKPKRSGMAIEEPSSVTVDGRLRARASIPLEDGRTTSRSNYDWGWCFGG